MRDLCGTGRLELLFCREGWTALGGLGIRAVGTRGWVLVLVFVLVLVLVLAGSDLRRGWGVWIVHVPHRGGHLIVS